METFRTCTKCKNEKLSSEFYTLKSSWCKMCQNTQIMEKRRQNPDKFKNYLKTTWTEPGMIFARKKANAKSEGINFTITRDQFIEWYNKQKLECHYCNINPRNFKDTADGILLKKVNLGIDRRDNLKGYESDNIVLCCNRCNTIKAGFFTYDEMKIIGKKFVKLKWRARGITFNKIIN